LSITRRTRKLSEIDNWFDSVSYSKGGAVLRMLRAWINRDHNDVTGLEAVTDAPSAASGNSGSTASTGAQWVPHLRRRLRDAAAAGDADGADGSSSGGAGDAATRAQAHSHTGGDHIAAAGLPSIHAAQPADITMEGSQRSSSLRTPATSPASLLHRHTKGPHKLPTIIEHSRTRAQGPAAAGPYAVVGSAEEQQLIVLAADAPVPADMRDQRQQQQQSRSIGSSAGWLAQQHLQQQLGRARELEAGVGAGDDKFMAGLGMYLREHAYSNSNYSGVWSSVGEVAGEDVQQMMSVWTLRR
jgi:hypothetical protein